MYEVKSKIYLEFTKTQKSALCNFLRALVKKCDSRSSSVSTCVEQDEQDELNDSDVGVLECNDKNSTGAKLPDLGVDEILKKFIEDEKYYLEINSPHFEFLADFLDDEKFISDTKLFIKECIKYYDYKKSQAPLIQAQKEFEKKKRKFLQEVKMSKELPTKKQISYYNSLSKRYNQDKGVNGDITKFSKLDLRNEIDRILNEHQGN